VFPFHVSVTIAATTNTSAVSAATSSSLDITQGSDATQPEDVVIMLEAEDGQPSAPMQVLSDSQASSGYYVEVPPEARNLVQAELDGGWAEYVFDVPVAGNYAIWGRVQSKDVHHNGFYLSMDSQPFVDWETAMGGEGRWVWSALKKSQESNPLLFALEKGQHILTIKQKDDGTRIDQILITGRPDYFESTVYEDAEDRTTRGWMIAEGSLGSAAVTSVFDEVCESHVIELAVTNLRNEYVLMRSLIPGIIGVKRFWNGA
jgi:hypothetical protein